MDHLQTSKERRARWYSKRWPRYIPVEVTDDPDELLAALSMGNRLVYSVDLRTLDQHPGLLQQILEQHGFAVISQIMTQGECDHALHLAEHWLNAAQGAKRIMQHQDGEAELRKDDNGDEACQQHISRDSLPSPPQDQEDNHVDDDDDDDSNNNNNNNNIIEIDSLEGGMMPFYGSAHSSFAWYVRSRPTIRRIFAHFYGTHDLLSSLDGVVLWQEEQRDMASQHEAHGWFHVDQNPIAKPGFAALQGLVNLLPTTPQTGGNALVVGSHKFFPDHYTATRQATSMGESKGSPLFYQQRLVEINGDDWLEIDPYDSDLLQPDNIITCLLQPGDFLVWDSRTVHCSYPPRCDNAQEGRHLQQQHAQQPAMSRTNWLRAATTVTMMPASDVTPEILQQRREATFRYRTLTHWVNKAQPLGEERPEKAALEGQRIRIMMEGAGENEKVLLSFDDLTNYQKELVVGKSHDVAGDD